MIGFDLTPEQQDLRDSVHEFARDVIRPAAPEYDEKEETPWPIMKQAHELGLDTYLFAEEYGGGGVSDMVTQMIVTEELTWGCAGIAIAISATGLCATAIQQCGTPEQKAKYMPMFCDPKQIVLGAMGLTESEAGSDVSAMKTIAKRVEGGYLLNGSKRFITNGGIADVHVIFATTDSAARWASPARRTNTPSSTRCSGAHSVNQSPATRRSPSSWPTWPPRSKPPGC